MQNEELRRAQVAIEESRDRYVDLYEFAPIGCLTRTREGMISEVNRAGTALLKTIHAESELHAEDLLKQVREPVPEIGDDKTVLPLNRHQYCGGESPRRALEQSPEWRNVLSECWFAYVDQ
jgi:PAS domain-containing protein